MNNCPLCYLCKRIPLTPTGRHKLSQILLFPLLKHRITGAEAPLCPHASDASLNKSLCCESLGYCTSPDLPPAGAFPSKHHFSVWPGKRAGPCTSLWKNTHHHRQGAFPSAGAPVGGLSCTKPPISNTSVGM